MNSVMLEAISTLKILCKQLSTDHLLTAILPQLC